MKSKTNFKTSTSRRYPASGRTMCKRKEAESALMSPGEGTQANINLKHSTLLVPEQHKTQANLSAKSTLDWTNKALDSLMLHISPKESSLTFNQQTLIRVLEALSSIFNLLTQKKLEQSRWGSKWRSFRFTLDKKECLTFQNKIYRFYTNRKLL